MEREARQLLAGARTRGFLAQLPPEIGEEVVDGAPVVRFPTGAMAAAIRPSIVLSGLFAYVLAEAEGKQITIRYVRAGDLVGTLSPGPAPLTTSIEAIEPSVLLMLDLDRLRSVALRHPDVALALVDELTVRVRAAYRTLASRSFDTVRSRVARDLIERARAGGRLHQGAEVNVTQEAIAHSIGSVREVVTSALSELRVANVIETRRASITIVDLTALLHEAHQSRLEE